MIIGAPWSDYIAATRFIIARKNAIIYVESAAWERLQEWLSMCSNHGSLSKPDGTNDILDTPNITTMWLFESSF
jgi:hypothetical protein